MLDRLIPLITSLLLRQVPLIEPLLAPIGLTVLELLGVPLLLSVQKKQVSLALKIALQAHLPGLNLGERLVSLALQAVLLIRRLHL